MKNSFSRRKGWMIIRWSYFPPITDRVISEGKGSGVLA
jgi:hypothetical protein